MGETTLSTHAAAAMVHMSFPQPKGICSIDIHTCKFHSNMKKSSCFKYSVFYYSSFSCSNVYRYVISDFLPCFGAAVILPSETDGGSLFDVSEPTDASSATSFWTSMLGGQSASSFWISVIAAHLTFEWQTSGGSRGPASSHTESIGCPKRHKHQYCSDQLMWETESQ